MSSRENLELVSTKPDISIGVPVYNGADQIREVLENLLTQSFTNFEIIISDNASTDRTQAICEEMQKTDTRITYHRQARNVGGAPNFKFVLSMAQAPYFIWAAADDLRSVDFLQENYHFLANNPDYVASTCPNTFENWTSGQRNVDFELTKDVFGRFVEFFSYCFKSHGIFYSLVRTDVLKGCRVVHVDYLNYDWLGFDWAIILYLATKGKINRTQNGLITFGVHGESAGAAIFSQFNRTKIEAILPFYYFSGYVIKISSSFPTWQRVWIVLALLRVNLQAKWAPAMEISRSLAYKTFKYFFGKIGAQ